MNVTINRNPEGKIIGYNINYPIKDSKPFIADLTREDVETIFGLYL